MRIRNIIDLFRKDNNKRQPKTPLKSLVLMRRGIEDGSIKRKLYKYRTKKQLDLILKNKKFYFAKFMELNDPFEFSIKMSGLDEEGAKNYINDLCYKQEPWLRSLLEQCIKRNSYLDLIKDAISRETANMGVFCCSAINDSILMWSHYADSHKGCCIEFDISKDMSFFYFPKPIEYSSEYMKCDFLKDGKPNVKDMTRSLFHKSSDWKYEHEYRIIKADFNGLLRINCKAIKCIILGCKMSEKDIEDIKKKIIKSKLLRHVKLKRCVIDDSEYKLNFVDVPLDNCPSTDP